MISLMRMLMGTLLFTWATTSQAEMGFDPRYERDYNIFTPAQRYAPDNPFNPVNRYDLGNPLSPANPLNPANCYRVDVLFAPLDGGSGKRNTR